MAVQHVTGSLFDAPSDAWLVHSCNCLGAWGRGVAAEFKRRCPKSFAIYHDYCATHSIEDLIGTSLRIEEAGEPVVVCLFTSRRYSPKEMDSPDAIVNATRDAVAHLQAVDGGVPANVLLAAPRLNAGLFATPWEDTEAVLAASGLNWVVYTP